MENGEPYSFGKPRDVDYFCDTGHEMMDHNQLIARIQYFHDYPLLQKTILPFSNDPLHKTFDRLISVHYEIFQDFIYNPDSEE